MDVGSCLFQNHKSFKFPNENIYRYHDKLIQLFIVHIPSMTIVKLESSDHNKLVLSNFDDNVIGSQ